MNCLGMELPIRLPDPPAVMIAIFILLNSFNSFKLVSVFCNIFIDNDKNIKSEDSVFVYISEQGYKNSVSLLMTKNGSKIMQSPKLVDGDLVVSKIDYLDTGRIVVTGKALPRLRVSLSLNGKYIGFSRVSDYKNFGLGANVEKLESGKKYEISIRLHDGEGTTIATVSHKFVMPEMTGDDNTFYTVLSILDRS